MSDREPEPTQAAPSATPSQPAATPVAPPQPPALDKAPLAYENPAFLNSSDGRLIRVVSEYLEPLARFRREQIQDTVVFFGSARIHSQEKAASLFIHAIGSELVPARRRTGVRAKAGADGDAVCGDFRQ